MTQPDIQSLRQAFAATSEPNSRLPGSFLAWAPNAHRFHKVLSVGEVEVTLLGSTERVNLDRAPLTDFVLATRLGETP